MTETFASTVGAWGFGLSAAAFLAFSAGLVAARRLPAQPGLLLGALAASSAWAVSGTGFALEGAQTWWAAHCVLDLLRIGLWLTLLAMLFQAESGGFVAKVLLGTRRWTTGIVAAACVVVVVLWPPQLVAEGGAPAARWGAAIFLCTAILALALIEQILRNGDENVRWRTKPVLLALGCAFAFDLVTFSEAVLFSRMDPDLWAARSIVNAVVLPFVGVTVSRSEAWRPGVTLSRGLLFHSVAFAGSGVFLLAMAAAGYYVRDFGGTWGKTMQAVLLFGALLVLAVVAFSGTARARVRVFVGKHFFPYRYDYREEWLRFTARLSTPAADLTLQQQCIRALADLVESPGGMVWLPDHDRLSLVARWNMPDASADEPPDSPFVRFLARTTWIIDIDEWRAAPEHYGDTPLPAWLERLPEAWLVVPLALGSETPGFVVLARPRAPIKVDWEVRDLLKTASRQAASYLAQIRANEALIEARKFDAFNRMSAFVVHDLKNLVAQLSLMLRNAERHRDNPEFQQDMLLTVENVVQRMNGLLLQLRSGTTPIDQPISVALEPIVRRVAAAKAGTHARLALDVAADVQVVGHADRLERVIGHLVQNALDASAAGGEVSVRVYRSGESAAVEVADRGVGMSAEFVRNRLFRPFQSSKPGGMGIGAYESAEYVRDLGGRIDVDSAPGRGTRITLLLPERPAAVPHQREAA